MRVLKDYPGSNLIILAFIAFIALGLPDGLLGVGWPSIHSDFAIPLEALGIFLAATVSGYMISGFFSGLLLSRFGVGFILSFSSLLTALALTGYVLVPHWWMMVTLGVIAGAGGGAVDAALNTYVAAHFGERMMQWLHASWGVGITLGPVIMTFGLTTLNSWRPGYLVVGGFQLVLAIGFLSTLSMWRQDNTLKENDIEKKLTDFRTPLGLTLRQRRVWISILLFFLYAGSEASLGIWVYSLLTQARGVDQELAGIFTGSYWFTFTIGRVMAGMIARRAGNNNLVLAGTMGALLGTGLLIWNPSEFLNLVAVAVIGFSIAPIFPAMTSGTGSRVGNNHAANTIGIQMTAAGLGAALIPGMMGIAAGRISLEIIPYCLLLVNFGLLVFYLLAIQFQKKEQPVFENR